MAGQQRGRKNPSQRGDFTGNKKEALAREHAETVEERRQEIGLVTAGQQAIKDEGVIDLMDKTPRVDFDDPDLMRALAADVASKQAAPQDVRGAPADGPTEDVVQGLPVDPHARVPHLTQEPVEQPQGRRLDGGGKSTIEVTELEPEKPLAAFSAGDALERDTNALNQPCEIKVMYDLEDVTIGYGNTYTFREGYRYRVPRWVAAHLEEKQLAYVTNLTPA